jgi:hypothetical protein
VAGPALMAAIISQQSALSRAIDQAFEDGQQPVLYPTLRCSSLGHECDRRLWYAYHWAHAPERFPGRILRIFENGHVREAAIIDMLRRAGLTIADAQAEVSFADGALTGHCDGVVRGVPEAPKKPHLLEIKTMNDKRWRTWRSQGVKVSDPKYWVQCQLYMHGLGLTRTLFVCENQDTREIEHQRIEYDQIAAEKLVARAERIARSEGPPARAYDKPDHWLCRQCPAQAVCWAGAEPLKNCRTCIGWEDGRCGRFVITVTVEQQRVGCEKFEFLPGIRDNKS